MSIYTEVDEDAASRDRETQREVLWGAHGEGGGKAEDDDGRSG